MMKIRVICVGKLKESYWRSACAEYEKRLRPFCRFSVLELPESRLPESPSPAQISAALDAEGERILSAAEGSPMLALCVEGNLLSSPEFAHRLEAFAVQGIGSLSFVVGSSYGLSDGVKSKARFKLSMSFMTFPHQLARVMLFEQIYRAFQILHHGKYHK